MSDRKTIQINPELFKVSGDNNKTRKARNKNPNQNPIKIRSNAPKEKNTSTLKRNILKMIREQQEKKKSTPPLYETEKTKTPTEIFNSEFDDSIQFLSKISKDAVREQNHPQQHHHLRNNQTIRQRPMIKPAMPSPHIHSGLPPELSLENMIPVETLRSTSPIQLRPHHTTPTSAIYPPYGCMKNGNLPTYRNWLNQTQRKYPGVTMGGGTGVSEFPSTSSSSSQGISSSSNHRTPVMGIAPFQQKYENTLNDKIKELSRIEKFSQKKNNPSSMKTAGNTLRRKQKKTLKRTYYVGKSKVFPKISVLVSNKTIRMKTNLKTQQLKQVPIQEVKKFLLKNGFIKIGTSAPIDVLRKMYESAQLICGVVKNHNPENLLYNYFNDPSPL